MYLKKAIVAILPVFLLLTLAQTAREASGRTDGCFSVRVEFRGREPVRIVGNVQYYRWTYRVYGGDCINRGLSHWVLDMCTDLEGQLSEISTQSVDSSDPPGGTSTFYEPVFGKDPPTGHSGLKWNYTMGNAIDKVDEYDEFSFVASGEVTQVPWAAKGSTIVVSGSTWGPGCSPVATEATTWGRVKTLHR